MYIMKIQFISYTRDNAFESENVTCKTFSDALAFDNFDITVISLQNAEIWKNKGHGTKTVNCVSDLVNLGQMISAKKKSLVLLLLPQDYLFRWDRGTNSYYHSNNIRSILPDVTYIITSVFNLKDLILSPGAEITSLGSNEYHSAFSICPKDHTGQEHILKGNGNGITVYRTSDYTATTIQIDNGNSLQHFLEDIGFINRDTLLYPDWLDDIQFLDEADLKKRLAGYRAEIEKLEQQCTSIEDRLATYQEKKSILCSQDKALQDTVVSMLEEIFPREEKFIDEGEEDYRFETDNRAFLFEIKGSKKSLKREHISKTENHVQVYNDLNEDGQELKLPKGILIFSEEINKPPSEHIAYVETQIDLASKYGILIISAIDFLKLYESFCEEKLKPGTISEMLWNQTGLWANE